MCIFFSNSYQYFIPHDTPERNNPTRSMAKITPWNLGINWRSPTWFYTCSIFLKIYIEWFNHNFWIPLLWFPVTYGITLCPLQLHDRKCLCLKLMYILTKHCDVTTVDLWRHANVEYWHCDVIFVDCSFTSKLVQRQSSLVNNIHEYRFLATQ